MGNLGSTCAGTSTWSDGIYYKLYNTSDNWYRISKSEKKEKENEFINESEFKV